MSIAAATAKTPRFTLARDGVEAKCVQVHDGDTAQFVFIVSGEPCRFTCRMAGYNSAEIRAPDAAECAAGESAKCALAGAILDKVVRLNVGKFDKYGRLLVDVFALNGPHINQWMVDGGHGRPYSGAGEKKW